MNPTISLTPERELSAAVLDHRLSRLCGSDWHDLGLRAVPVYCQARDGRRIGFAAVESVPELLRGAIDRWFRDLDAAVSDSAKIARAAARFWYTFIAIHPFLDGNGRTAKAMLCRSLATRGLAIPDFALIDRYLLEGDTARELDELTYLFLISIQKESP